MNYVLIVRKKIHTLYFLNSSIFQSSVSLFKLIVMSMFFTEFKWVEYFGQYYFYGEEKLTWEDAKVMYLHCY